MNELNRSKRRTPIVFYVGVALLIFAMLSFNLTSGLYARYVSRGSASDEARVASFMFDVEKTAESKNFIDISDIKNPGDSVEYSFTVSNGTPDDHSEVAQNYSIKVLIDGNMPLSYTLNDTPITAEGVSGVLAAGEYDSESFKLYVEWPEDLNDESLANGSAVGLVTLVITSEQID